MDLSKDIFFAFWFFLPAGIANMMPVFAALIPGLKKYDHPMDLNRTYRGKRIFGSHKTFRGLIAGVLSATVALWLQQVAVGHSADLAAWTSQVDYTAVPVLLLGPLFGLGALLGDAVESFFKRQIGRQPGQGWFPFDQTDYIIGGALATMPFIRLSLMQYALVIGLWLILHIASNYVGYFMGIKEKPFS
ncbi:MAG TPA: CDP-archaeol synthase [Candidatus Saccharimonadales bacterium]